MLTTQVFGQDAVAQPDRSILSENEVNILRSPAPATTPMVDQNGNNVPTGQPVADTPRRFHYVLSATVRGVYDDNVFISTSNPTSDYYFVLEPSIYIALGGGGAESVNSLSLTYRPSVFLFIDNDQNNAIQHVIRLQGNHVFGHLSMSLSQDVQILDGQDLNSITDPTGHQANIDVGARSKHQIYTTGLGASYDLTGKLSLSLGGALLADQYETLISSQSLSGNMYLNYSYSEKLIVGLGGSGGYNTTDNSFSDQTFEQINLRMSYNATGKISLSGSVGVEFRQSESQSDTEISPVFDLSASYHPFDGTVISLIGSRRTQNSAVLAGQDFSETTISASVTQRFMQRFTLTFAVGYTNSDYFSVVDGFSATRTDDYFYVEPAVDANITRYWTIGAYFLHREDSSSVSFFSFNDNQVGLRSTVTF